MSAHVRPYRLWTTAEEAQLRELYADTPTKDLVQVFGRAIHQIYGKANKMGLAKSATYMASPHACRLRRGDNIGAAFQFQKGHVPANKGLRQPGWAPGRMAETQFKKGQRPRTWKPLGSERLMDGYLQRKVTDTGYPPRDWKGVHLLLWEEAYGPVPKGYAIKFIDGDRTNIALGNLCLVSRGDLARLNVMWNRYPRELAEAIQLRGVLIRKINRRIQREKQD